MYQIFTGTEQPFEAGFTCNSRYAIVFKSVTCAHSNSDTYTSLKLNFVGHSTVQQSQCTTHTNLK